ncbi:MAG: hypothetical protein RIC30_14900 [Marinoscillum sp.]|uniref:hypothetical protein n=1 Tax=Marinoscillum sp. TaxID=2024838 RepID=UPI0032F6C154
MKKQILLLIMTLSLSSVGFAQDYTTGIGIRGGYFNGLTIKHFVGDKAAFEGILTSRWRGFQVTGLYEIHNQAFHTPRLNWYYGFGAHIGFWDGNETNWGNRGDTYTVLGIDGILGIEYNFSEIPINIGIDWKPSLNLVGYSGFWGDGGALSIRYIF